MFVPPLNPHARIRVARQGDERQPVVVIDDLLADPGRWTADALRRDYAPIGRHYPGLRAVVPFAEADRLRAGLRDLIARTFELDPVPALHECYYSVVTTAPERLAPIQRLPHVDGLERERIAILIYLSGAEQGGTAFYRQRGTGFETLDADRFAAYDGELTARVARHGLPPPAYVAGDTPLFEQVAEYAARPNRALIYRSHALHCAAIPPGARLSPDPSVGRLSINAFLFDPAGRSRKLGADKDLQPS